MPHYSSAISKIETASADYIVTLTVVYTVVYSFILSLGADRTTLRYVVFIEFTMFGITHNE